MANKGSSHLCAAITLQ